MRVLRKKDDGDKIRFELVDDADGTVPEVSEFLCYLKAKEYSPHTLSAYAYDLLHFSRLLAETTLGYGDFKPVHTLALITYLRQYPVHQPSQRRRQARCTTGKGQPTACLSSASINRILAVVSSFYEYLIVSERYRSQENPL